ncbi:hypothetical protein OKW42_002788 [Paraburkholderia sp. WC7.3d]
MGFQHCDPAGIVFYPQISSCSMKCLRTGGRLQPVVATPHTILHVGRRAQGCGRRARHGIKESTRWTEEYERVAERAATLPATRLVYVSDRESDVVALMVKANELGHPADSLLRSQHDRTLADGGKLWDKVTSCQGNDVRLTSRYSRNGSGCYGSSVLNCSKSLPHRLPASRQPGIRGRAARPVWRRWGRRR